MNTTTVRPSNEKGGATNNILLIGGAIVLLIGLFFLSQYSRSVTINRSATGFDGLSMWLTENDVESRNFYGRATLEPDTVALRILPLLDVDLRQTQNETNDELAAMAETDRDIGSWVVRRKLERLPTLLVMPKWRAGVRSAAALHPKLLIADDSADTLVSQIEGDIGKLVRDRENTEVVGSTPTGQRYTLHYPQTLESSSCEPLIGSSSAMILGECTFDDTSFWVLADPDLLNNHGLSQGQNAEAALNWLPSLTTDDGAIVVDVSTATWTRRAGARNDAQRSWSDLSRFFEYPFAVIWWSFGFLAALMFWRAWRRYGAADARSDEENGMRASRLVSIDTKARLLRLTGRDDVLVRTYIDGRLDVLADEILGAQRTRGEDGKDRLVAAIARRSPDLAEELARFNEFALAPTTLSPDLLLRETNRLDDLIERTMDEFGRTRRTS